MPRAGRMDRRIVILRRTQRQDQLGAAIEEWREYLTVFAEYGTPQVNEQFSADRHAAMETATFTVRTRRDWTPSATENRVRYRGRDWDVTGVAEIARRSAYQLTCQLRAAATETVEAV